MKIKVFITVIALIVNIQLLNCNKDFEFNSKSQEFDLLNDLNVDKLNMKNVDFKTKILNNYFEQIKPVRDQFE